MREYQTHRGNGRSQARGSESGADTARAPGRAPRTGKVDAGSARGQSVARQGLAGPDGQVPFRGEMEQALSADFSGVQAHTGPEAARACQTLDAQAYTMGASIAFADAQPSRATVAHELTHVLQQGGAREHGVQLRARASSAGSDAHEAEAEAVAVAVTGGFAAPVQRVATPVMVAREPGDGGGDAAAGDAAAGDAATDATAAGDSGQSELEAALSSMTPERAAREVAQRVSRGEIAYTDIPHLALSVAEDDRDAFWTALAGRASSAIRSSMPTDRLRNVDTAEAVDRWLTENDWENRMIAWAAVITGWRDALPESYLEPVMAEAVDRAAWQIGRFASVRRQAHRAQDRVRAIVRRVLGPALGDARLAQAYQMAEAQDLDTVDQAAEQRAYEADRAAEPFDRAAVDSQRLAMQMHLTGLVPPRTTLETQVATGQDIDALLQAYATMVETAVDMVMEYKRLLHLGTNQASEADLSALQEATATLHDHTDFLNRLRIEREAEHVRGAPRRGITQERENLDSAGFWETTIIPGLDVDKRPQQQTLRSSYARGADDIDQVVLHEGGRSTTGTLETFVDRGASSHFAVNPDGTVAQLGTLGVMAGHTPGGSERSVGIDLTFYDGPYVDSAAAEAYIEFLEESPAQIVALSMVVLRTRGALEPGMSLAPPTSSFDDRTDTIVNDSDPGVYAHGSATVPEDSDPHSDPGDLITQEFYKWVLVVEAWERTYGPINIHDEGELTRLQQFMDQVEQATIAEYHEGSAPYVAEVGGTVTNIRTRGGNFQVTITDADGGAHTVELPEHTTGGDVRLTVAEGDTVTSGQALVHVNPYNDREREIFAAKITEVLAILGR